MRRSPLLLVLALATVCLGACEAETTEQAEPGIGELGEPDVDTTDLVETEFEDVPELPDANEERPVVLGLNGIEVPVEDACAGVDGAILAQSADDITVTLVREAGEAIRYEVDDMSAETTEVVVDASADDTVYSATVSGDGMQTTAVTMVVDDTASTLPAC